MASNGYPEKYDKGFEIKAGEIDGDVFYAGAKEKDGKLVTDGGRVLGVTVKAKTLKQAVEKCYKEIRNISFENATYRKDIGKRAIEKAENN